MLITNNSKRKQQNWLNDIYHATKATAAGVLFIFKKKLASIWKFEFCEMKTKQRKEIFILFFRRPKKKPGKLN